MMTLGHSRSFLATVDTKTTLIIALLGLSVTSLPILACQPGEVNCDCNVTKLEVEADPVGPDSPKKLNSIVQFKATTTWSSNSTINMNVYVGRQLLASYTGSNNNNNNNLSCGDVIQEVFQFVNKKLENSSVSGHPIVEVVVFVDHHDNPRGGDQSCEHPLCKKFVVYYHFPPAPENVLVRHTPRKVTRGDMLSVSCSTEDGYPKVEQLGIRAFDADNKQQFYAPIAEVSMNVSDLWSFQCEATSFPFGEKVKVESKDKVKVIDGTNDLLKRSKEASSQGSVADDDLRDANTSNIADTMDTAKSNNAMDTTSTTNNTITMDTNYTTGIANTANTTDTLKTTGIASMKTASTTSTTETSTGIAAEDTTTFVVASSTEDRTRDFVDLKTSARSNSKIKSRFTSWPRQAQKSPATTSRSTREQKARMSSEKPNLLTPRKSAEDSAGPVLGEEDEGGMFDAQIDAMSSDTVQRPLNEEPRGKDDRAISDGMVRYPVLALELALMGVSLVICHLL